MKSSQNAWISSGTRVINEISEKEQRWGWMSTASKTIQEVVNLQRRQHSLPYQNDNGVEKACHIFALKKYEHEQYYHEKADRLYRKLLGTTLSVQ